MAARKSDDSGQGFDRLGDLLADAAPLSHLPDEAGRSRGGHGRGGGTDPARAVAEVWVDAVGDDIAENAQPLRLNGTVLVVATSSSAWAQTLHLMSGQVRGRLNESLGTDAVTEIVFRHAGWQRTHAPRDPVGAAPPRGNVGSRAAVGGGTERLDRAQEAALAEVEALDLAPQIKEKILRAMRDSFVRGEQE